MLKKWLWLPLVVAILQGCTSVTDSGSTLAGLGFASDTTAILFYYLWEETERPSIPTRNHGERLYGWEFKLVDVRFNKIYWSARIDYSWSRSQILGGNQWNDSTMFIELTGDGYWLWTVGNKKPQKINFNWNVERENYENRMLLYDFRLRPWKNDSVLIYSKARQAIIDSRTMTVNDWSPMGEDVWINNCDDFWWGKDEGGCLINKPNGFTLLSDKSDVLGDFIYTYDCVTYYDRKCDIKNIFYHHFIRSSLGECEMSVCDAYPIKAKINESYYANIRYDDKWKIDREPLFWMIGLRNFIDSLGNITEY